MRSGIVLLQNQITLLHKRDCNRTQDLIPIPYRLDLTPFGSIWNNLKIEYIALGGVCTDLLKPVCLVGAGAGGVRGAYET